MEILSLGEKIKRKRKKLNMTLKDLAKDRITPGQISLVEAGRSNPSMDLLEYLAINLNTTVDYLMESEESQAENISLFYEKLATSCIISGDYEKGKELIQKSKYYASKYNLEYRKGKVLYLEGCILGDTGELKLAQQKFLSANMLFSKNNIFEEIVNTFLKLGNVTLKLKSYNSANNYLLQAERVYINNNIENHMLIGGVYYNLSKVFSILDKPEKSLKYAELAENSFNIISNKEVYSKDLVRMSEEASKRGDIHNALNYADKALEINLKVSDDKNLASIEKSLGDIFYNYEKIDKSFDHYKKAKEIKLRNTEEHINEILICICKSHIKKKEIGACEEVLKRIQKSIGENDIKDWIEYNLIKYRILCIKEDRIEAESLLIYIYNFAKEHNVKEQVAEIGIRVSQFYMDDKNEILARKYLDEAVLMYKEICIV